jgi:hypothetical protein
MLIRPLGFEQFGHGVNKKHAWPCPRWLEGSYETNESMRNEILKYPQNGTRLNSKPTLKNKRNRTRENHKKGGHLRKSNNRASLGNKARRRVNIINVLQEVA